LFRNGKFHLRIQLFSKVLHPFFTHLFYKKYCVKYLSKILLLNLQSKTFKLQTARICFIFYNIFPRMENNSFCRNPNRVSKKRVPNERSPDSILRAIFMLEISYGRATKRKTGKTRRFASRRLSLMEFG